jgi:hypothetical protein
MPITIAKPVSNKEAGAFYSPEGVASSLLAWAIRSPDDRLLDPACGDGRFIAGHRKSVGIEQDAHAAATARTHAPWALVHEGDFFEWAANTKERFECAAGNPPFIRYQTFKGEVRARALDLCAKLGTKFSGLTSSWAPFLVAAASLLEPGGRMAFVTPAEIGHAPYAAPLLEYLISHFGSVRIVAIREKLFPSLSEDCWLLFADGFGGVSPFIEFSIQEQFVPSKTLTAPSMRVSLREWRNVWNRRLRPFLAPKTVRDIYRDVSCNPDTLRFGDIAAIGIGYVSGANDFFHLRPSVARAMDFPSHLLHPTVRNGRVLPAKRLTEATVQKWRDADDPMLLLCLSKTGSVPRQVLRYLDTDEGRAARETYKCRNRDPWYSVPDVQVPDLFLSYMSGISPSLVSNEALCSCTNSVHGVRIRELSAIPHLVRSWDTPFMQLSCELEGHSLGGGLLKLEPREAAQILLPPPAMSHELASPAIREALHTMRRWRHYSDQG